MQGDSELWKQLANTVKTNNQTKRTGKTHEKTNKHSKRHETNVVCDYVCLLLFLQSDSSVCSDIRGIRKRHPFSHAVQLTWIDQWLIYSAAWRVSYPITLSSIFFKVELGFLVFILKEFQTCDVSSATDVAQLDTFILEISKIQLVVYYQCCVLVGWATTRLYVIAP